MTEKLKLHTPNITDENVTKIAPLFPHCISEGKIDFELLKQELSNSIIDGTQERYQLNWVGKREALLTANAPIAKTLRPNREESVNFDSTENLYIEGDNLDALKLLQETYLNKVKMIYIDPPYNTGNDFIYEDDFAENTADYLQRSNQKDESGNRLTANPESNGRFHSDWLSMMYPRLKLARNLLRDDGVIFISIDDNEQANLKRLCDEVFGEDNLLFQITVLCNPKGRSHDKFVANCHEYLMGYSRSAMEKGQLDVPKSLEEVEKNYKLKDARGVYRELELRNTHREFGKHNRSNLFYPFYVNSAGQVAITATEGDEAVFPIWEDGFEGCWTWGVEKTTNQLDEIVAKKVKESWKIYRKNYAFGEDGEASKQVKSIWVEKGFYTEKGQTVFNELFDCKGKIFQSPKSISTIRQLLLMSSVKDCLVLDFFSGSATTAHAVMQLNAEDGGKRKFIMVQIPEACDPKSEAYKAGYKTITEIGKERIRRAGQKIKTDNALTATDLDIGFRVLKIDSSNMKDVYYTPDNLNQNDLFNLVDNVREDRSAEDLLFQVLLDWGVDLTLPITQETIAGFTVLFVDDNALAACFDANINEAFVKELAARHPMRVVFRDTCFANDSIKINIEQIFKLISPATEIKTL